MPRMARRQVVVVRSRAPSKRPTRKAAAAIITRATRITTRKAAPAGGVKHGGISSAAVEKATGRGWAEWFAILDKAGARSMTHKEIAALLHARHRCPPWWSQMVTVGYEQARGLRARHQVAGGYQVGASRTVNIPIAALYRAWADPKQRLRWLGAADLEVRRATANRSLRITWQPKKPAPTSVEVMFYEKGAGKSQVTVQHSKLKTAAGGQAAKKF